MATVLSAILRDTPPPPRKLRPDTPRETEGIVLRCLAKEPEKRYASTQDLVSALRGAEQGLGGAGGLTLGWRSVAAVIVSSSTPRSTTRRSTIYWRAVTPSSW